MATKTQREIEAVVADFIAGGIPRRIALSKLIALGLTPMQAEDLLDDDGSE